MASFTMVDTNRFPPGQSVAIYPVTNWTNGVVNQNAAPIGSATDTQTMGTNNLTFVNLTDGVQYVAYALVNGQHRYTLVRTPTTTDSPIASEILDSDGTLAANSDLRVATQKAVKTYSDTTKSGKELGYAQITTDPATALTTLQDIAGLTVTVTVGTRPIMVKLNIPFVSNSAATGFTHFGIARDGTLIAVTGEGYQKALTAGGGGGFHTEVRETPSAGSHTYKAQFCAVTAGTSTITGSLGTAPSIQVVEV